MRILINKNVRKWILGTGLLLPLILVSVLTLVVAVETPEHGKAGGAFHPEIILKPGILIEILLP
jgi:hypothetical protein